MDNFKVSTPLDDIMYFWYTLTHIFTFSTKLYNQKKIIGQTNFLPTKCVIAANFWLVLYNLQILIIPPGKQNTWF